MTMKDPIFDHIEKARADLLKKHGGWEGVLKHMQELDKARLQKKKTRKKGTRRKTTTSR